ncbi:MAG: YebC/PmpR family DNA-binding transcriptional regulator [Candidatus Pacebacteria bacterium]|nr:YebC/PmpR family DNA-binding transcriptional regulator [Candidatus Paceibacterota bacterium]
MSGHSHFKNIKRRKDSEDKRKASVFSKMSKMIIASVRENGKDPDSNTTLRTIIEKARKADMPKEKIERAILRGSGEGDGGSLEFFSVEVYGPENVAIIIEGSSSNKNRTIGEIKEVLKRYNGKIANLGSVKWLFEQKGVLEIDKEQIPDAEEFFLEALDFGAEEIKEDDLVLTIYTSPTDTDKIKSFVSSKELDANYIKIGWKPTSTIKTKKEDYKKIIEELEENEDIEGVYSNAE